MKFNKEKPKEPLDNIELEIIPLDELSPEDRKLIEGVIVQTEEKTKMRTLTKSELVEVVGFKEARRILDIYEKK